MDDDRAMDGPSAAELFDRDLRRHLDAIDRRDLDAYSTTIADDATLILPNGTVYGGRDEFLGFIREFLAAPRWTQDLTELRRVVDGDRTAAVLYDSVYQEYDETDAVTAKSHFLLSLTFTWAGDRWVVIVDQNTRLPE